MNLWMDTRGMNAGVSIGAGANQIVIPNVGASTLGTLKTREDGLSRSCPLFKKAEASP
jgi:hypothetical protein